MTNIVGWAFTGSFCTLKNALEAMANLAKSGKTIQPIFSYAVRDSDTRFLTKEEMRHRVEEITDKPIIDTIVGAEPIGPKKLLSALIVAPATGNTIAKIRYGITDTPVTMAVKAHLRNNRPVILAIATNDGLGANGENVSALMNRKNIFIVPYAQDDWEGKPNSLISNLSLVEATLDAAYNGEQLQPVLLTK